MRNVKTLDHFRKTRQVELFLKIKQELFLEMIFALQTLKDRLSVFIGHSKEVFLFSSSWE